MTRLSQKEKEALFALFKDLIFHIFSVEKAAHDYQFLLRRAKKLCVQVPAAAEPSVLERFQGRLIHVTGSLLIKQAAEDCDLNFKLDKDPIILKRKVEMLKYRAGRNSPLEWTEVPCDEKDGSVQNGTEKTKFIFTFQLKSALFYSKAFVGSFSLSEEQLRALENWSPCDLSESDIAKLSSSCICGYKSYNKQLVDDGFNSRTCLCFNQNDTPQWGDIRVSYDAVVAPEKVTIVGVLQDDSLREFTFHDALLCARPGFFTAPPVPEKTPLPAIDGVWPFVAEKAKAILFITPGTQRLHEALDHEDKQFSNSLFQKRAGALLAMFGAWAILLVIPKLILSLNQVATYINVNLGKDVCFLVRDGIFLPLLIFILIHAYWLFFALAVRAMYHPVSSALIFAGFILTINSAAPGMVGWQVWSVAAALFALGILRRCGGEEARFATYADLVQKEAATAMAEAAASESGAEALTKTAAAIEAARELDGGFSLERE